MKIGILTGGGDVQPLNTLIASVKKACNRKKINLIGFRQGWQGVLENDFVDLKKVKIAPNIGGTILRSSRVNLKVIKNSAQRIIDNLKKSKIDGLIVIGGEDTLSNSLLLREFPQVLISKTIDNDVGEINGNRIVNYFTLGHPTAAEKISSFVSLKEGVRTTAYSHKRIIIVESMGMHAGWLAMSSILGKPDFIIIPEFPLNYELLLEQIRQKYMENSNVVVVISEGAKWENGEYISADATETDDFGHPRFIGAASALKNRLKKDLSKYFDTRNVNFLNPSYLYRAGKPNPLDSYAAKKLGNEAVRVLSEKIEKPLFLAIKFGVNLNIKKIDFSLIDNIEQFHRFVPENFYNKENFLPTQKYIKYISRINKFRETLVFSQYLNN